MELLAQSHYKCFQSLRLAHKKLDETRHAEQTFSHLQNAANRAREVIMQFNQLRAACAPAVDVVPDTELGAFAIRITKYRNAIHEDMLPMCLIDGQMHIPKVDRLDKYKRWSALETADRADLVVLRRELNDDFNELCRLIGAGWTAMLARSDALIQSAEYQRRMRPVTTITMQRVVLSSNVSE